MYTRNFGKQKYTPPPGYDGTAFSETMTTKMHEPQMIIREESPIEQDLLQYQPETEPNEPEPVTESETPELPVFAEKETHHKQESALGQIGQLLGHLKGKIGSEELIILLVMLLIASDGMCAEVLILGLLLIAG